MNHLIDIFPRYLDSRFCSDAEFLAGYREIIESARTLLPLCDEDAYRNLENTVVRLEERAMWLGKELVEYEGTLREHARYVERIAP